MGNSGILRKVLVHSAFNSHTACTCARINCSYKGNESGAQLYDVCRSSPVHQWKGLELSSPLMYGSMGHRSASQAAQTYKCAFLPDSWHSVNQWLVDSQSKSYMYCSARIGVPASYRYSRGVGTRESSRSCMIARNCMILVYTA